MADLEVLHPVRMHVEFTLVEKDTPLFNGTLLVTSTRTVSCFGRDVIVRTSGPEGEALDAQMFCGLIFEHQFSLPASSISVRYLDVVDADDGVGRQVERFKAALQMGVHRSDDWEVVGLTRYDLLYRCKPL